MAKKKNRLRDSLTLINSSKVRANNGDITETVTYSQPVRCAVNSFDSMIDYQSQVEIPESIVDFVVEARRESIETSGINELSRVLTSKTGNKVYQVTKIDYPTLRKAVLILKSTSDIVS